MRRKDIRSGNAPRGRKGGERRQCHHCNDS